MAVLAGWAVRASPRLQCPPWLGGASLSPWPLGTTKEVLVSVRISVRISIGFKDFLGFPIIVLGFPRIVLGFLPGFDFDLILIDFDLILIDFG